MAPRRYDRRRRDEAVAAVRARIVGAVVDLHAELGPSRTTYAMIAKRADVAIPTVYKHFPAVAGLLAACIGHVSARVPALTPDVFSGCGTTAERLTVLTHKIFDQYCHFAPWLRWSRHEVHLVPDLAGYLQKMRDRQIRLVTEALRPTFGARIPPRMVASIEVLISFDAWRIFTVDYKLASQEAAKATSSLLSTLVATPRRRGRGSNL